MVFVLLNVLHVDLALLIAGISWALNFIPELGAIVSLVLPIPLILLDSRVTPDCRLQNCIIAVVAMVAIKMIVGNFLEVKVMSSDPVLSGVKAEGDHEEHGIHPVAILFFVVLFGDIWGPMGMLISVPLISIIR